MWEKAVTLPYEACQLGSTRRWQSDRQPIEDLERAIPTPRGLSRGRGRLVCCSATAARVGGRSTTGVGIADAAIAGVGRFGDAIATFSNALTKSSGQELMRERVGRPPTRGGASVSARCA